MAGRSTILHASRPPTFKNRPGAKLNYLNKPDYKGKPGPKLKEIDWKLLAKLFRHGTTPEEAAGILDISEPTLRSRQEFLSIYRKNFCAGNISLRRRQYRAAMSGNSTLLIWLGKNRLGQKDEVVLQGDKNNPLVSMKPDLRKLTVEELMQFRDLMAKTQGVTLNASYQVVQPEAQPAMIPATKAVAVKKASKNGKAK